MSQSLSTASTWELSGANKIAARARQVVWRVREDEIDALASGVAVHQRDAIADENLVERQAAIALPAFDGRVATAFALGCVLLNSRLDRFDRHETLHATAIPER